MTENNDFCFFIFFSFHCKSFLYQGIEKKNCHNLLCVFIIFRFPRNARKRQNWLNQMIDSTLSSWQPSPFSVICSEHFEDSSFRYLNGKRLVKDEAFPTKFLHSKVS